MNLKLPNRLPIAILNLKKVKIFNVFFFFLRRDLLFASGLLRAATLDGVGVLPRTAVFKTNTFGLV